MQTRIQKELYADKDIKKSVGCMTCPREVDFSKFTELDKKEFRITGMCKKCMKEVFR